MRVIVVVAILNKNVSQCTIQTQSCIIWKQSGNETKFVQFHLLKNSRHVVEVHVVLKSLQAESYPCSV